MFSSFFTFLGLSGASFAVVSLQDKYLQVAQIKIKNNKKEIICFNEITVDNNLIKDGVIVDNNLFRDVLEKLFTEASPCPIKAEKVFVNIPSKILYSFVKDFFQTLPDDVMRRDMNDYIDKNSPFLSNNLIIDYSQFKTDKVLSFGASSVPKKWGDYLKNCFEQLGFISVNFVPEPYIRLSMFLDKPEGDFICLHVYDNDIFVYIFHNSILYDSFIINNSEFNAGYDELKKNKNDFFAHFNKNIFKIYAEKSNNEAISGFYKKISSGNDFSFLFIDQADYNYFEQFNPKNNCFILNGLIKKILDKS